MKILDQIPLIYLAARLYPNLGFHELKEQEFPLLYSDALYKLRPVTDIGDHSINEAMQIALKSKNARQYFEATQLRKNAWDPEAVSQALETVSDSWSLEEVFPPFLVEAILGPDEYERFATLLDCLTTEAFSPSSRFGFPYFWRNVGYKDDDVIDTVNSLSILLDTGVLRVLSEHPFKFGFGISKVAYDNLVCVMSLDEPLPLRDFI